MIKFLKVYNLRFQKYSVKKVRIIGENRIDIYIYIYQIDTLTINKGKKDTRFIHY